MWSGDPQELQAIIRSLNQLMDLDLALIEDAYPAEYMARLQRSKLGRGSTFTVSLPAATTEEKA
jgi:hypothetical protein